MIACISDLERELKEFRESHGDLPVGTGKCRLNMRVGPDGPYVEIEYDDYGIPVWKCPGLAGSPR